MPTDPASENINSMDMIELTAFQGQDHQAHIMAHLVFASSPMIGGMPPVAMSIQKHVMEHVKLQAEEQAMAQMAQAGLFCRAARDADAGIDYRGFKECSN